VTCREATEFLTEYLANELPPASREAFEHHLAICPNCRVFLSQFEQTIAAGGGAYDGTDAPASEAMPDELVRAILSALKK
jgi:anti-sigma factor RsiW